MKLHTILSGGQTGADKTGLVEAKRLGLKTGGTAPKGWRVDGGVDLTLKDFGLTESPSSNYPPRTEANVVDSDATVWFGNTGSPGYYCTRNYAKKHLRALYVNPDKTQLQYLVNMYETVNIAGNRSRINPAVVRLVQDAFKHIEEFSRAI